jgi:hypothetical protein
MKSGSQATGFLFLVACSILHVDIDFVGTKPNTKGLPALVKFVQKGKFPISFYFSNQIKSNQIKSNQIKSNQIKSNQI